MAKLVLVVDDDPSFHELMGLAIRKRGAEIESATSAFGLVNRLAHATPAGPGRRPDVVVLDCGLPALSGPVALELISRNPRACEVPIVLVSAAPPIDLEARLASHPNAIFRQKDGRIGRLVDIVLEKAGLPPAPSRP